MLSREAPLPVGAAPRPSCWPGRCPARVDPDWYAQTVRDLRRRDVELVVDSEGDPLRQAFAANPDWVAPNQAEAEEMVGHEFSTDADFALALDEIAEMGPRNVLITRENGVLRARARGPEDAPLPGRRRAASRPVSTVGSGDALLAGFLAARVRKRPVEECLRQAVGCGTANTRSVGAGRFDPRDATRFAALSRVTELTGSAV